MRVHLAAPLAVLALVAGAPAAHAASVSIERDEDTVYVSVVGGAEADALTVSSPAAGRVVVTQAAGAVLTAGNRCAITAPGRAECASSQMDGALMTGGDGDDRLAVSGAVGGGAWLFGGNGADDLTGGAGIDRLDGGAGPDVLRARDGRHDALYCGSETDSTDPDDGDAVAADCEQRVVSHASPVSGAAPAPPAVSGPAPLPVPVANVAPAPVDISTAPVALDRGAVPMSVSCSAARACTGWIVVRLLPRRGSRKATAAGARRPVIARRPYRVGAGGSKTLRVHISRRGRTRVLQRRKARCSVRISSVAPDGSTQVRKRKITIKAGGGR